MVILETDRLVLRKWTEADADSLFEYAKDSDIGPIAGWPPHKSIDESLDVIRNVFNGEECYAICEKGSEKAIKNRKEYRKKLVSYIITHAKMFRCRF